MKWLMRVLFIPVVFLMVSSTRASGADDCNCRPQMEWFPDPTMTYWADPAYFTADQIWALGQAAEHWEKAIEAATGNSSFAKSTYDYSATGTASNATWKLLGNEAYRGDPNIAAKVFPLEKVIRFNPDVLENSSQADVHGLILHELGHTLGFELDIWI